MKRLGGLKDLVFHAVEEVTNLVERTHHRVSDRSVLRFAPVEPLTTSARTVQVVHDAAAQGVYRTIRVVNRGVKQALDTGLAFIQDKTTHSRAGEWLQPATPVRSDAAGTWPWLMDHGESALNALYGDYLHDRGNGLDLGMTFRRHGRILSLQPGALTQHLPRDDGKICIFIHGLGCTEWSWSISAEEFYGDAGVNFGSMLESDLGITPHYVRYNTGRHVSENGKLLAGLINRLMEIYSCDLREIILVGHSMGGLVARSALHHGHTHGLPWAQRVKHVFCLGSPHLGAPLEKILRIASYLLRSFPSAGTEVPADVIDSRSSGIKDLGLGYTQEAEWMNQDPDELFWDQPRYRQPFVRDVNYYLIGATFTRDVDHPLGRLLGDLLVRPASATCGTGHGQQHYTFTMGRIFSGISHMHLANHPDVYAVIKQNISVGKQGAQQV